MIMEMYQLIFNYLSLIELLQPPSPTVVTYCLVYLLGGLTLLPGMFLCMWYVTPSSKPTGIEKQKIDNNNQPPPPPTAWDDEKKGWIQLVMEEQPGNSSSKKFNSDRFSLKNNTVPSFFAILRHGTLFCFDNETEKTCQLILPIHNYTFSLSSSSCSNTTAAPLCESELYGRSMSICLAPHQNAGSNTPSTIYYLTCQRPCDKEDWYFTLLAASRFLSSSHDPSCDQWRDSTMYDPAAMLHLQHQHHPWWSALLGRLFLGIYKTDTWRAVWHTKLTSKLDKINMHLLQQHGGDTTTTPLELQQIHMGDTIPCLTNMTLETLDTNGYCVISGQLTYDGDLWAVIRTDVRYLWRPLGGGGGLVVTLNLRHCSGKVIIKVKPPPSNRIWVAFDTMPTLEWQVTPVVWDKQIKWSLVTQLIQGKLNEMVMDTLVMPNMEDVPFFDSEGRGGIFGDRRPTATAGGGGDSGEKQQQQQPMSKWVQGYFNRIKVPHKTMAGLHPGSPKATKV